MSTAGHSLKLVGRIERLLREAAVAVVVPRSVERWLDGASTEEHEAGVLGARMRLLLVLSLERAPPEDAARFAQLADYISVRIANVELEGRTTVHVLGAAHEARPARVRDRDIAFVLDLDVPRDTAEPERARFLCKFQLLLAPKPSAFAGTLATDAQRAMQRVHAENGPGMADTQLLPYTRLIRCTLDVVSPFVLVPHSVRVADNAVRLELVPQLDTTLVAVDGAHLVEPDRAMPIELNNSDVLRLALSSANARCSMQLCHQRGTDLQRVCYELRTQLAGVASAFDELGCDEQLQARLVQVDSHAAGLLAFRLALFNGSVERAAAVTVQLHPPCRQTVVPVCEVIDLPPLHARTSATVALAFVRLLPGTPVSPDDLHVFIRNGEAGCSTRLPPNRITLLP